MPSAHHLSPLLISPTLTAFTTPDFTPSILHCLLRHAGHYVIYLFTLHYLYLRYDYADIFAMLDAAIRCLPPP